MPLVAGAASVAANVILCQLLMPAFGLRGLALASAVSLILPALILLFAAGKRYRGVLNRAAAVDFVKMLVCAGVMGAAVWFAQGALAARPGDGLTGRVLLVLAPTLLGVLVYIILTVLLRVSTISQIKALLHRRKPS